MSDQVAGFELFPIEPRWVLLKLTTDEGLVGWGEPVVEGKAETVMTAVSEMMDYVVGSDPDRIEDTVQALYRGAFYRGGPILMSAISGIEQALWDIKGKRLGVPVHELLGGAVRESMAVYRWVGGDSPSETADQARAVADAGWTAVKMNGVPRVGWLESPAQVSRIVAEAEAVREAVGWDFGIGLDFHGRVHKGLARILLKELEPMAPMFVEEPVLPEHGEVLADLAASTSIPLACGERLYGRSGFQPVLEQGAVSIIQPDLSHAGGIWEVRKIAAQAEAKDIAVAPHAPLGPVNLAASLQLDFCTPNALIQETSLGIHYNEGSVELLDYVLNKDDFAVRDGSLARLTKPGLGVEVDEERVRAAAGHRWRNPLWRQDDGTVAEW